MSNIQVVYTMQELVAEHTFAWAEEVLSDNTLVAGEGAAARLVSYIRQDESPHVEYLKTVLSEMRDRTFVGPEGKKLPGASVITRYWEAAVADSLGAWREGNMQSQFNEIIHALQDDPKRRDILEEFHSLGTIRPNVDQSSSRSDDVDQSSSRSDDGDQSSLRSDDGDGTWKPTAESQGY